ncbi:MAG: hypothetical protein FVQ85_04440 [Planctomycetes bacterium]|nr:hypothetical protein [Planctomycetota bacterium]
MREEERKEKSQKSKIKKIFLLAALSCLFSILALMILWKFILRTPVYRHICLTNLREFSAAIHLYASDHNGVLPTPSKWCDLLIEGGYARKGFFKCPSTKNGPCNYAMNQNVENIGPITYNNYHDIVLRSDIVLLFETGPGWNQFGGVEILTAANHEDKGCNVLFWGGLEFVRTQDLHKLKWKPDEVQEE